MKIVNDTNKKFNEGDLNSHQSVMAIIYNQYNQILMLGHNKFKEKGFKAFTMPVGKVDEGDSVKGTLFKEVKEEIGVDITKYHEVDVYEHSLIRHDKRIDVELHTFKVEMYELTPFNAEPKKHYALQWHSLKQIEKNPEDYLSMNIAVLKRLKLIK